MKKLIALLLLLSIIENSCFKFKYSNRRSNDYICKSKSCDTAKVLQRETSLYATSLVKGYYYILYYLHICVYMYIYMFLYRTFAHKVYMYIYVHKSPEYLCYRYRYVN